ncbi:MAG: hypothetical protein IAF94_26475 [Pirellulaceae bacterium]|nr:hypothetical protein [Pirellulaceae bacterium]
MLATNWAFTVESEGMDNDNPYDDDGPYTESGDSFQEFTDDRSPPGQPRKEFPLFQGESADFPLIEFICFGADDSGDLVPS